MRRLHYKNAREPRGDAVFVVTGGGSGIGQALVRELAARGHSVLAIGRREAPLLETVKQSSLITYLCADVSSQEGRKLIHNHLEGVPHIKGLIHNAGTIEPILPIVTLDETGFRKALATNVEAPLFLSQMLRFKLREGRVLHIGSGAAYFPVTGWTAYCVSKAALAMLTRCWQLECKNIAVASVMPGIIDTDMQAMIRNSHHMDPLKVDFFKRLKQDNQLVTPLVVAQFLCWLLLDIDEASFASKEWDIYDTTHHSAWLIPPLSVPHWE